MGGLSRTLRNLDLNLLLLLEAIVRRQHLTAAARELGMTQSAASQALGRLRGTFEDPLFIRTGQGMMPTPRARELASQVGPALESIASVVASEGRFSPETSTRTFTLCFGAVGELALMPRLLSRLLRVRSAVFVQSIPLPTEAALRQVRRAELDLVLDYEAPLDDALRSELIVEEELVVIARRGHPRIDRELSREAYFAERHITVAIDDRRRRTVEHVLGQGQHARVIAAEVAHQATVPALVMASDAIATVPRTLSELPLYREHLTILPAPWRLPPLPTHMIWHRSVDSDPGHQWLRQTLLTAGDADRSSGSQ